MKTRSYSLIFLILIFNLNGYSQNKTQYWNKNIPLISFRIPPDSAGRIKYVDLDKDGDPDVLKTFSQK